MQPHVKPVDIHVRLVKENYIISLFNLGHSGSVYERSHARKVDAAKNFFTVPRHHTWQIKIGKISPN